MNKFFRKLLPKKKEMKAYYKMHKRHRKELIEHAKKTKEWDWCFLHDSVMMQIKHMHEYYSAGNNVYQIDESRNEIIKQLEYVLSMEGQIERGECDNLEEKYEEMYRYIGKNMANWWDQEKIT